MSVLTVTVAAPDGAATDVRFDGQQSLASVLVTLVQQGRVAPATAGASLFRSATSGRLVSAVRPLAEEGVVEGDLLIAVPIGEK